LLLPAFFAFTGMRTRIDLVSGMDQWLICGLIILVATVGKFGGTFVAARLTGLGWRNAAALGTLMNTRGLMELIVLNIGLDLKVISPTLFAMMVLMALVTTMVTAPMLRLLIPTTASNAALASERTPDRRNVSPAECLRPILIGRSERGNYLNRSCTRTCSQHYRDQIAVHVLSRRLIS